MNNKCLIRQGYHNSGEPITVVPELKRNARNRFSGIAGALGSSYVLRYSRIVLVHDGFELTDLKVTGTLNVIC